MLISPKAVKSMLSPRAQARRAGLARSVCAAGLYRDMFAAARRFLPAAADAFQMLYANKASAYITPCSFFRISLSPMQLFHCCFRFPKAGEYAKRQFIEAICAEKLLTSTLMMVIGFHTPASMIILAFLA